jgi:hypothetical protein
MGRDRAKKACSTSTSSNSTACMEMLQNMFKLQQLQLYKFEEQAAKFDMKFYKDRKI